MPHFDVLKLRKGEVSLAVGVVFVQCSNDKVSIGCKVGGHVVVLVVIVIVVSIVVVVVVTVAAQMGGSSVYGG